MNACEENLHCCMDDEQKTCACSHEEDSSADSSSNALTTIQRAALLLEQEELITQKICEGASLEDVVDPSNRQFGAQAHSEQEQTRLAKRAMLIAQGIQPYPVQLNVTDTIAHVRSQFEGKLEAGEDSGVNVGIAGRVLFVRKAGGLCFVSLADGEGNTLQGMVSKGRIGEESHRQFKQLVDIGDHLFLQGSIVASKTGELSLMADQWQIAAKALQPLPALHKDLNEDTRVRKPYVAMIADDVVRSMVRHRSRVVASLRKTFSQQDFLEVETPMLQTVRGGAAARPFTTHINAFDMELYLRIAPELFLKRCLVGGLDRVFEINRNFRNEGVDATHAPEFAMLEAYQAYGDYNSVAQLTQQLIQQSAIDAFGSTTVTLHDGSQYDFGGQWREITMYGSLSEALGEEITPDTTVEYLGKLASKFGLERDEVENHGKLVEKLWEHFYEDRLYEPTFVRDFPVETSPLVKSYPEDERVVQKWDLYVRGFELATGYSELNDPVVQRARLVDQAQDALKGDAEAMDIDEDFLEALCVGMPPAGGIGMGIDRLLIALTGASIRETITFPLVKPLG